MSVAMVAAHLANASLDEVAGWTLRQVIDVVTRSRHVIALVNPMASPPSDPVEDPKAHEAIAHAFGLVKR